MIGRPTITSLFDKRAGWFVALAWLLLVMGVLASLGAAVSAGLNAFYHPQHEWAGYDRALARFLQLAYWIGAAAAVGSSLALAWRWRVAASVSVVACWIGLIAGGAVYLNHLNSIPRGPEYFDRYAGEMHFRIPWQYGPSGSDQPALNGIHTHLCLDTLSGWYEKACIGSKLEQVSIYPAKDNFMDGVEATSWQRRPEEFNAAGLQNGHQAYVKSIPAEGSRPGLTVYYFRRTDPEGKLFRAVQCFESGGCTHYARQDRYVLYYTAPRSLLSHWEETDRKLKSLVDSWIVP